MDDLKQKHTQMFFYMVSSFEMAALQQMGKIKSPLTDKIERNLEQAQFTIDLLDMVKVKTEGNLGEDENKFLEQLLGQLKLNYLDEVEKDKKENTPKENKSQENSEKEEDSKETK
jgi:hypothetical protein